MNHPPSHTISVPLPSVFTAAAKEFPTAPSAATSSSHVYDRRWISDANSSPSQPPTSPFPVRQLTDVLNLTHTPLRESLYALFLSEPAFHARSGETLCEERSRLMGQWAHIVRLGVMHDTISSSSASGRARYDAVIEACGLASHSLDIKMSVHYGLFGATVAMMGSPHQVSQWLPKIERCEMLGCFALTELGHGSNVRGIQTIAEYDVRTQQFVIHTPCDTAQKYWIGGAATTARWTAAFAQLYVSGTCHGIHAFVVRIREDNGKLVKGVTLADCGAKAGMNGVDNGRIWFNHVRVPHGQLLARHSQVDKQTGVYASAFASADERFGASLASLSGGRVSVATGALNQAKIGLAIAVRYALQRRAFGGERESVTLLLDYPLHQRRLLPLLAGTTCMQIVQNRLKHRWHNREMGKYLHVWSSAFKAVMTWHALGTLQECRESCGGQGYKAENRIAELKASHDVALTYEGDNHILLQAVSRAVLPEFLGALKKKVNSKHFGYLAELKEERYERIESDAFITHALRRREAATFALLAKQIEECRNDKSGKKMSTTEAFNACAYTAELAGVAHAEMLVWEVLGLQLDGAEGLLAGKDEGLRDTVRVCGRLMMAHRMDNDPQFLRVGAITAAQGRAVGEWVGALCAQVRPLAPHIVDGFGLPPHLLAPIAFDYVAHNGRARI